MGTWFALCVLLTYVVMYWHALRLDGTARMWTMLESPVISSHFDFNSWCGM